MTYDIDQPSVRVAPNINVTPLIDVLLVLLIIFMVASPLKLSRFKALVPEQPDRSKPIEPNILTLVVTIDRDLRLKLNGQSDFLGSTNNTEQLSVTLAKVFADRKASHAFRSAGGVAQTMSLDDSIEKTVFIKAPRSIAYGHVTKVIDGIKEAGAQPIGLQIDDLAP